MDPEGRKFGVGPRELNGAVDLINQFRLVPHHEFFCKRPLPLAISHTHYFHNVVGDTEIRRGEGMELDQLLRENPSRLRETSGTSQIRPFDLETLGQAFQLRETSPIDLPSAEKGTPTISSKLKSESKDKDRKHKKHKDREKDKEHKKHKHRHKDKDKDKTRDKERERKKEKSNHHDKRKHEGFEDSAENHKRKRSKAQEFESR
ncbi:hypothetical protein LUZ60_005126 [Juncus effusus]|nr:hypothetical protein LUZ60_005126 [Juncus effusus]